MRRLNRTPLEVGWNSATLNWDRQRKKDKIPDVTVAFGYGGALCFSSHLLANLFPSPAPGLEFLTASIDGESGLLLNCLRVTEAIDRTSSDLQMLEAEGSPPWIFDVRWINIVDERALRWDAFCIPNSTDPATPRRFLITDLFVDRVRNLGLRGLDFKHVGYIVADASQAVPKPPAPPPPAPAREASKPKPPELSSVPLPAGEQIELAEVCAKWRQRLQLSDEMAPEAVLQRITEEMQKLRLVFSTVSPEERIDILLGLSAVYGELLHSACGWSWVEVREGRSKRWIAMLAPSGAHALALVPYLQKQIQSESPTATLLFNMIAAGQLPPAEPRQLVLVA